MKKFIHKYFGHLVLASAMLYAVITVVYNDLVYNEPDVAIVRICHWQLEAGFRESLQALIDDYEKVVKQRTGENIRILQVPISEKAYQQYINTGLIGGMAPDIIEKGKAKTAVDPSYVSRFFLPLGTQLSKPNPYNKGTVLESMPWKDTFFDGMHGAYDKQLLGYYYIPFSVFTLRLYYNKNLYHKITGRDNPPATFQDFMRVCGEIKEYAIKNKLPLVPIAASKAQGDYFASKYRTPFRVGLAERCDMDFDGSSTYFESYFGMRKGLWNFKDPALLASSRCMMEIASNFSDGWLAAQRDDALFMFAQGRAVMIASGSWDARSIIDQTKERFETGVFRFPMPTDTPEYNKFVKGPASEADSRGGIPWIINKKSKHTDVCVDFLQFCTTAKNNERFNTKLSWLPVIRGVKISDERMKAFRPILQGYSGLFNYFISTAVQLMESGNLWTLYSGQMTPEQNAEQLQKIYDRSADSGFLSKLDEFQHTGRDMERSVAAKIALLECVPQDADETVKKLVQLDMASQSLYHKYYEYKYLFEKFKNQK